MLFRVAVLTVVFGFFVSLYFWSEPKKKRVALVIGNSSYIQSEPLGSARINAEKVSRALLSSGFEVISGTDLTGLEIEEHFQQFGRRIRNADVAVLYYSGYVAQTNGRSYLAPIDEVYKKASSPTIKSAGLLPMLSEMATHSKANIIMFDACKISFANLLGQDPKGKCQVLETVPVRQNMMISYGTGSDIDIKNMRYGVSRFTESVLSMAERKHALIQNVMFDVQNDVARKTNQLQIPRIQSNLGTNISLNLDTETARMTEGLIMVGPTYDEEQQYLRSKNRLVPTSHYAGTKSSFDSSPVYQSTYQDRSYSERETFVSLAAQELGHLGKLPGAKTRSVIAELDQRAIHEKIFGKPRKQKETEDVEFQLQRQLARLGCYTGLIDGIWGVKSRRALSGFFDAASLPLLNDRPSLNHVRLTKSYSGSDCNVRRNRWTTQFARVSPDQSVKVALTSKTDPTLQPVPVSNSGTEVEKMDLSAVLPDGQYDEWIRTTRPKRKSAVRRKNRVFAKAKAKAKVKTRRYTRPSRAKSWKKRTLARLLETSD